MKHSKHTMHRNSLKAYAGLDLSKRKWAILRSLARLGGRATDRQIARSLKSADPNVSRPGITMLCQAGILAEVDTTEERGRKCRIVGLNPEVFA